MRISLAEFWQFFSWTFRNKNCQNWTIALALLPKFYNLNKNRAKISRSHLFTYHPTTSVSENFCSPKNSNVLNFLYFLVFGYRRKLGKFHVKRNHIQQVTHGILKPGVGIVCCVYVYNFPAGIGPSVRGRWLDTIPCGQRP